MPVYLVQIQSPRLCRTSGIRLRAEGDKRTAGSAGLSESQRQGFAALEAEDKAVEAKPPGMGGHLRLKAIGCCSGANSSTR
jgi:hypothetical protein